MSVSPSGRHILTDSGAQAWLGDLPDFTWPGCRTSRRVCTRARGTVIRSRTRTRRPTLMYTSGTTGAPKGVQTSRRAIAADIDARPKAWQWSPDDVLVHGLPMFHVHGLVLGLLGSLRIGNPFVHTGKPTPQLYAQARTEAHGTLFFGVPTVWSRVVGDRGSARALAFGPAAGVGQCTAAGASVRRPGDVDWSRAGRAVRQHGSVDHDEHLRRR